MSLLAADVILPFACEFFYSRSMCGSSFLVKNSLRKTFIEMFIIEAALSFERTPMFGIK